MVTEVIMPKMGQTMETGKIVKWLKKEGEKVEKGEPLLEIETDKTTIEVESRGSGILKKIVIQEGEEAPIAATIGYIVQEGESFSLKETVKAKPFVGEAQKEALLEAPKRVAVEAAARVKASPLAKKVAEEKGLDLSLITGTGPEGRITREDVLAYLANKTAKEAVEKRTTEVSVPEFRVVSMSSMRRAIARKMTDSKTHVPHFYVSTEVDMTEAVNLRETLLPVYEAKTGFRISFTHLLVKTVAIALKLYPQLNSTLEGDAIKLWQDINIGIAVNLEDGLIVPVLRKANNMSLFEIVSEASKLVAKARERKLKEEEFSGGTFTISNMGAMDVGSFVAIINIPEAAILATGKIADKPSVVNQQIVIRKMMTATLSADHRIIDGVLAAKFLQKIKELLESPQVLNT